MGEWGQSKELRIMSSHVHIGLYDALREAGASDETARAGAVDIPVGQHLATKEDLLQAIAGVNDRIAKLTTDVASLRVSVFTFGPIIIGLLVKLVFFPITLIRGCGSRSLHPQTRGRRARPAATQ